MGGSSRTPAPPPEEPSEELTLLRRILELIEKLLKFLRVK
jgi:hypothetical protein